MGKKVEEKAEEKAANVEKLAGEMAKVDGLKDAVDELIQDQEAGQSRVGETEKQLESKLESVVKTNLAVIEGTGINEKQKEIEQEEAKVAAEAAEVQAQATKVAEK